MPVEISGDRLFEGCEITGLTDAYYTGVSSDSRRIKNGNLFICHRGLHRDGAEFAAEAIARGASRVLAERPIDGIPPEKTLITADTRLSEAFIWRNLFGDPAKNMKTVAVTGTAGKTSVVFLLRHIMSAAGAKVGMISTVKTLAGDEEISLGESGGSSVSDIFGAMTTPDPEYFFSSVAKMAEKGCDTLIYEASSQGILYKKTAAVHNDIAVYTNLSPEHLDCHGDMENYFAAKAELMKTSDCAVINADDGFISRIHDMYPSKKVMRCTVNSGTKAEAYAADFKSHAADGIEYLFISDDAVFRVRSPMIGMTAVYNTLEAALTALLLGADPMTVRDSLRFYGGADGRMTRVLTGSRSLDSRLDITVFIDYAHTPEALRALLISAREIARRTTVLFGCGGDRDRSKRPEMARIAQEYADRVIVTSDNPRSEDPMKIIDEILEGADGGTKPEVIPDRREAIAYAIETAESGEAVLLCGKGHEKYEILADGKHSFDEYETARKALEKRSAETGGRENECKT